ncbi:MAG: PA14 domain-containing protein [Caldilineales bacterium]|nr:PA14 domain-containing protein [Caldilineales bacterium]
MHRLPAQPTSARSRSLRLYGAIGVGLALLGLALAAAVALRWLRPQPELRLRLMPAAAPLSALGDVAITATGWRRGEKVTLCVAADALAECPEDARIGSFQADRQGRVEARAPLAPLFGRGLTYVIAVGERSGAVARAFRVLQEPSPVPGRRVAFPPTATPSPSAGQVVLPVVEGGSQAGGSPSPAPTETQAPARAGWQAEYFANRDLVGPPALTTVEAALVFDWGRASPGFRVPPDNFSARWTRAVTTLGRRYDFEVRADDGVRVYVDGRLALDEWHDVRPNPTYTFSLDLTPGEHTFVVEYYEAEGDAFIEVAWREAETYPDWRGEYFANSNLAGEPVLVRNDLAVDFAWGEGSPAPGLIPEDDFSARWTRYLELPPGAYRFEVQADDGFRLFVDGQLVLDRWQGASGAPAAVDLYLGAGAHLVRLEFFESVGEAAVVLQWYPAPPDVPVQPPPEAGPTAAAPVPGASEGTPQATATPAGTPGAPQPTATPLPPGTPQPTATPLPPAAPQPTPAPTATAELRAVVVTPTSGWANTVISVTSAGWPPNTTVILALLEPLASLDQADDLIIGSSDVAGRVTFLFQFPDEPRWLALSQVQIILHDENWQIRGTALFTLVRP